MKHRHEETMKQKIIEKFDWTAKIFHTIDLPQYGEAVYKVNKTLSVNALERNFGWQEANETQHKWHPKENPSSSYPICKSHIETQDHARKCKYLASKAAQKQEIDKLEKWRWKQKFHRCTIGSIFRNMRFWMDDKKTAEVITANKPALISQQTRRLTDDAVSDQTTIGWKHFSCGRISSKWQREFDSHHNERSTADPRARMKPMPTLIRKLWDLRQAHWRNRNAMNHSKTPEEREQIIRKRLCQQITRAHAAQHSTVTLTA